MSHPLIEASKKHPADLAPLIGTVVETGLPMVPGAIHREWLDLALRHQRLLLLAPRFHAKSEFISGILPAWVLGHVPQARVLCITGDEPLATAATRRISSLLTSPLYRAIFPTVPPILESSQRTLVFQGSGAHPSWYAESIGSVKAGSRADLIILDDCVTHRNSRTPDLRDDLRRIYTSVILPMLAEGGKLIAIGTPWYADDLYADLAATEGIYTARYSAIQDDGSLLWPEVRTPQWLADLRVQMGATDFEQQLLCRISQTTGELFQRDWFDLVDECPPLVEVWTVVDTATSEKAHSDARVFLTMGRAANGVVYVTAMRSGKWPPTELQQQCIQQVQTHAATYGRPYRGLLAEDVKENTILRSWLRQTTIPLTLMSHGGLSKAARAEAVIPACAQGKVKLLRAPWNGTLLAELVAMQRDGRQRSDDAADCLVYGTARLLNIAFTTPHRAVTVTAPLLPAHRTRPR